MQKCTAYWWNLFDMAIQSYPLLTLGVKGHRASHEDFSCAWKIGVAYYYRRALARRLCVPGLFAWDESCHEKSTWPNCLHERHVHFTSVYSHTNSQDGSKNRFQNFLGCNAVRRQLAACCPGCMFGIKWAKYALHKSRHGLALHSISQTRKSESTSEQRNVDYNGRSANSLKCKDFGGFDMFLICSDMTHLPLSLLNITCYTCLIQDTFFFGFFIFRNSCDRPKASKIPWNQSRRPAPTKRVATCYVTM